MLKHILLSVVLAIVLFSSSACQEQDNTPPPPPLSAPEVKGALVELCNGGKVLLPEGWSITNCAVQREQLLAAGLSYAPHRTLSMLSYREAGEELANVQLSCSKEMNDIALSGIRSLTNEPAREQKFVNLFMRQAQGVTEMEPPVYGVYSQGEALMLVSDYKLKLTNPRLIENFGTREAFAKNYNPHYFSHRNGSQECNILAQCPLALRERFEPVFNAIAKSMLPPEMDAYVKPKQMLEQDMVISLCNGVRILKPQGWVYDSDDWLRSKIEQGTSRRPSGWVYEDLSERMLERQMTTTDIGGQWPCPRIERLMLYRGKNEIGRFNITSIPFTAKAAEKFYIDFVGEPATDLAGIMVKMEQVEKEEGHKITWVETNHRFVNGAQTFWLFYELDMADEDGKRIKSVVFQVFYHTPGKLFLATGIYGLDDWLSVKPIFSRIFNSVSISSAVTGEK